MSLEGDMFHHLRTAGLERLPELGLGGATLAGRGPTVGDGGLVAWALGVRVRSQRP